jgi:hypothetical protein
LALCEFDYRLPIVSKRRRLSTAGSVAASTMTTDHPFLEKGQFALLIVAIIVLLIFALTFVFY